MGSQLSTLNSQLIETHAHLDYPDFAPDFDDVLRRATEAGVTRIITIGTSIESSRRAVALAEKHPNVFADVSGLLSRPQSGTTTKIVFSRYSGSASTAATICFNPSSITEIARV